MARYAHPQGCHYLVLLAALTGSALLSSITVATTLDFRRIAVIGDHAAQTPAGVVFEEFGGLPGIGEDFPPRIDEAGNVVFHAKLVGPGVNNGNINDGNALGVWKQTSVGQTLVARQDDPAPGTAAGVEFMGFPSPLSTETPLIAGGHAAFLGGLRGPGIDVNFGTNATGIWSDTGGPLALLYRLGDQAPDLPAGNTFRLFSLPFFTATGRVAFNAVWRAPGDSPGLLVPNQEGFWSDCSGVLHAVAKGGDLAPMTEPGVVFGQGPLFAIGGAFRDWDTNLERLTFIGNLRGPGINDLNDEGIWLESPGGLGLIAREGAAAPGAGAGVHFGAPNGIDCFSDGIPVRIDADGDVMFGSRLSGPQVPFMRSIWTNRSGQIALVVRGTLPLTGSAPGDPAPGLPPGYTFSNLVITDFNAPGQIAFTGVVTFNMNFDDQTEGIWWENPGGAPGPLSLLAHEGDQVPGLDPGVLFDGLNRFLSFGDNGQAAFLAFLRGAGVNGSNNTGLFLTDLTGAIQLVLRTGSLFEVGSERDQRTIAIIVPGHLNVAGELPVEIDFTDGSSGLFVARITDVTAVVEPDTKAAPAVEPVRLDPLFPNPMVESVTIPFALGAPSRIQLRIHDVMGRTVIRLLDEARGSGRRTLRWDGRDELGRPVARGVYFVELSANGGTARERLIIDR
jgi:hypothetical protein